MENTDEKFIQFQTKLEALKAEYQINITPMINFPQYAILPDEVQLALKVLEKAGMKLLLHAEEIPQAEVTSTETV